MTEETRKENKVEEIVEEKETKSKTSKKKEEVKEEINIIEKYYVCSRLNHPVEVSYGEHMFMLPPRGKVIIDDISILGKLPNGCYTRKIV